MQMHLAMVWTSKASTNSSEAIFARYSDAWQTDASAVCVNANFCVHTWLLSLEEQYRKGKLPPVLYHQIDGGSENANVLYLVICFMLVAKGLCLKVVLSRLLPGHTHEGIDALFALIWHMVRDEIILTPSEFKLAIEKAFQKLEDVKV